MGGRRRSPVPLLPLPRTQHLYHLQKVWVGRLKCKLACGKSTSENRSRDTSWFQCLFGNDGAEIVMFGAEIFVCLLVFHKLGAAVLQPPLGFASFTLFLCAAAENLCPLAPKAAVSYWLVL